MKLLLHLLLLDVAAAINPTAQSRKLEEKIKWSSQSEAIEKQSRSHASKPTTTEQNSLTNATSKSTKSVPTRFPAPTPPHPQCQDLPRFIDGVPQDNEPWVMPGDSVWQDSSFVNMTCSDLEQIVPETNLAGRDKLCKFLSQGVYSGPCSLEACCFCGGGQYEYEPRCENMKWNAMQDAGIEFNCEFIDEDVSDKDAFCANFGEETFTADGLALKDACCACGGGQRLNHDFSAQRRRNLQQQENASTKASKTAASVFPNGESTVDINFLDKIQTLAGGISNMEYLGLGYDMVRGNPRGTEASELDPGFRYRVLRLRQDQTNKTLDYKYVTPLGTMVKYTSSCKYDDSSVEISSESDLRTSLSKESRMAKSESSSKTSGIKLLIFDFSSTVEKKSSFSQSSKFQAQSEENRKSSSISFEARAICSEFEASFIPGYDHELSPEFQKAVLNLPVPYNKDNLRHRGTWDSFFETFGTSYVTYLVLGGKRIHSSTMSQRDYSSLVSQSVDVASTLSYEMGSAMGASAGVKAGLVKAAGELASTFGGPKGQAIGSVVNLALSGTDDDEPVVGVNVNGQSSSSLSQFASSRAQAEAAAKISEKKVRNQELSIGGLPSEDWRQWAVSVKDRPMPVRYELGSIMDFMTFEQTTAFRAAFEDLYEIDLSEAEDQDEPFLNGTTFHGVYTGSGEPLSLHSLNPNDDSRVLMQNDVTGIGGGTVSYNSSQTFQGDCLDSAGQMYSALYSFSEKKDGCFEICQGIAGFETEQVGMSFDESSKLCSCFYDEKNYNELLALGRDSGIIFPIIMPGEGPVNAGTGNQDTHKCYVNQNYGRAKVFKYSDTYKGKLFKPTALFATPIRKTIAPDLMEEVESPFNGDGDPWNKNIYFALTEDINSEGVLAVTNFGEQIGPVSQSQLPNYSFITTTTLGRYSDSLFRSGVVAFNGLMLNEEGKDEFDVITRTTDENRTLHINFRSLTEQVPTVLVFANWLSLGGNLPRDADDVDFAMTNITNEGFTIFHSKASPVSYLGFNFAVISQDMPTENLKHGIITECTEAETSGTFPKHGFDTIGGCNPNTSSLDWVQPVGSAQHSGVKIKFDKPFADIPSVVATPLQIIPTVDITEQAFDSIISRCVVEAITRAFTTIKCGMVDESGGVEDAVYRPIPFTFIAVGNTD